MWKRKPAAIVDYGDHLAVVANNTGREFLFDKDMARALAGWGWNENGPGYLHARVDGKMMFAHHLVVGKPGPADEVDHINRDPRDNRRQNLRIVPRSLNHANSRRRSDNHAGFKGVCFDRGRQRFMASAHVHGRSVFIGRFDTPEKAAKAYDDRVVELYGDHACTNVKLGLLSAEEGARDGPDR